MEVHSKARFGALFQTAWMSLKLSVSLTDNVDMIRDLLEQGLPVSLMATLIVSLWVTGIWALVKDERGPAATLTKLLLVGFVAFLVWWFAVPFFR